MDITPKDLLDAGVHFGHQVRRWNPGFKPYLHDHLHGISIIDLEKTHRLLEEAGNFVSGIVAKGKDILLVGTKKQAQEIIREAAGMTQMPFCANRWMGGTLTNFTTIQSSLQKYRKFLQMEEDGSINALPKKEVAAIRRQMERMHRNFEGLINVEALPAALFVVDVRHEDIAVAEARRLGIPVVGIVDTNSNPSLADYPIPGNDDASKSIRILTEVIVEAIQTGMESRESVHVQKTPTVVQPKQDFATDSDVEAIYPEDYDKDEREAAEAAGGEAEAKPEEPKKD